jgi:hypothetical protein
MTQSVVISRIVLGSRIPGSSLIALIAATQHNRFQTAWQM